MEIAASGVSQPVALLSPVRQLMGSSFSLSDQLSAAVSRPRLAAVPSVDASRFSFIRPADLPQLLHSAPTLILDIRPYPAFATARLPGALSLSVPSTLLKRPTFSLAKLATMLPTANCQSRFQTWRTAGRILVYDSDSSVLANGNNILGLLRKFQAEGFTGDLTWLKGGFSLVRRDIKHVVDESPLCGEQPLSTNNYLRAQDLPTAAFQESSTTSARQRPPPPSISTLPPPSYKRALAYNPFYDNIRQNIELAHGITERIPLVLPDEVIKRKSDLPFQWLRDIVQKACDAHEGTEALAVQFYRIELGEQKRLMGVMAHHTRESAFSASLMTDQAPFPFSIAAAVEKGTKNRYKDIWPFEHARVKLKPSSQSLDDYINASHILPLGTNRRYIATQGPLESTFTDFWTLVWEQNVRVIVMLTKEKEGNSIKCGTYWSNGRYGPNLRLELIDERGPGVEKFDLSDDRHISFSEILPGPDNAMLSSCGGVDFASASPPVVDEERATIKRTFRLYYSPPSQSPTHSPPLETYRVITQFQYLAWSDLHVPRSPKGLLGLIREVNSVVKEFDPDLTNSSSKESVGNSNLGAPVLLHCSAGVGRTGGFIIVDAVLDGIRRELNKSRKDRSTVPLRNSPIPRNSDADSRTGLSAIPCNGISAAPGTLISSALEGSIPEVVCATNRSATGEFPTSIDASITGTEDLISTTAFSPTPFGHCSALTSSPFTSTNVLTIHRFTQGSANQEIDNFQANLRGDGMGPAQGDRVMMDLLRPTDSQIAGAFDIGTSSITPCPRPGSYQSTGGTFSPSPPEEIPCSPSIISSSYPNAGYCHPYPDARSNSQFNSGTASCLPGQKNVGDHTGLSSPFTSSIRHTFSNSSGSNSTSSISAQEKKPMMSGQLSSSSSISSPPYPGQGPMTNVFDFTSTRPQRGSWSRPIPSSPMPLSTFDEPIRHVLEDMREQRMSLCQSLRQYIFVHRAILEGVLEMIDEATSSLDAEEHLIYKLTPGEPSMEASLEPSSDPRELHTLSFRSTSKRAASPLDLMQPGIEPSLKPQSVGVLDQNEISTAMRQFLVERGRPSFGT